MDTAIHLITHTNKLLSNLIDWILRPTCVLCGSASKQEISICLACEEDLPWIENSCEKCSKPMDGTTQDLLCGHCIKSFPIYEKIYALFGYEEPVDRFISNLKFHDQMLYAKMFGILFTKKITHEWYKRKALPQYIIPVPLHNKRLRERGYNQSLEIARFISKKLDIPIDIKNCKRIRATKAQALTAAKQRYKNVRGAFRVSDDFKAKHVVIIDDIVTTGNTVTDLCRALKIAGVKQIDVWCVARPNKNK